MVSVPPKTADIRPPGAKHDSSLPQWAVDKTTRRRGRRHAHEIIDPIRTALLIIDLTRSYEDLPCAASIIPPVARLAETMRGAGGTVVWVLPAPMRSDDAALAALWGDETLQRHVADTAENSARNEPFAGLVPASDDLMVHKQGYSALFPGASRLHAHLTERNIDTVIVTGVLTNICCESTARDAFALGYRVIVVADANAARSDEEHQASLYNILRNFGDVRMSDELIDAIAVGVD